ncbi:MAG TPA: Asp23/Gls24 family envelope stress response protein [Thermoleophilia bacterium]|nr:Asp23/Gls24 family envelope stress response protein [Thermoleophilia bacterium]
MLSMEGSELIVADYRISPAVLRAIVRHSLGGDPRVRLAHGVSRAGRHAVDVAVSEGACAVTVHMQAPLGEDLLALGSKVKEDVETGLAAMTGMPVARVDVHVDGVYRASASTQTATSAVTSTFAPESCDPIPDAAA